MVKALLLRNGKAFMCKNKVNPKNVPEEKVSDYQVSLHNLIITHLPPQ